MRWIPTSRLLVAVVLLSACPGQRGGRDAGARSAAVPAGLSDAQRSEVLARVGDRTITLGEFADRLAAQSPYLRARYASPERRRELLDNMVRFELLVQEARARGLDHDPSIARLETQALVDELLKTEVDAQLRIDDIADTEVRAYFDAHPEEWNQPEQVRASHLRFAERAAAQRALEQVLAAPNDVELFRRLAREQSTDGTTRNSGGDLRFFGRLVGDQRAPAAPPAAVIEAAFSLADIGAIAPRVVQSEDGFHVVRLTARRQPMNRTYPEVKRIIQDRLHRERREARIRELVTRLRGELGVREDAAALATVRIDPPAPGATP